MPEVLRERAGDLSRPAQLALRPAVDEHERRSLAVAPLLRVQPEPPAAAHLVRRRRLDRLGGVGIERVLHLGASFRPVGGPA